MIPRWQVCILIYDYLKNNEYQKSLEVFNDECQFLRIPNPVPDLQKCVIESLIKSGDLLARLNDHEDLLNKKVKDTESIKKTFIKINCLEKELGNLRKSVKRKKRDKAQHNNSCLSKRSKKNVIDQSQNLSKVSSSISNPACAEVVQNTSYFPQNITNQSQCNYNSVSYDQFPVSSIYNINDKSDQDKMSTRCNISPDQSCSIKHSISDAFQNQNETKSSFFGTESTTPEKTSSRRKTATPKKLPQLASVKGNIETLAQNINSKNENAALETLTAVEPWLEQFINSISEPNDEEPDLQSFAIPENTEGEAALSLLALNPSGGVLERVNEPKINVTASETLLPSPQPRYCVHGTGLNTVQSSQQLGTTPSLLTHSSSDLSSAVADSSLPRQTFKSDAVDNCTTSHSISSVMTSNQAVSNQTVHSGLDAKTDASTPISQPNFDTTFDPIVIKNKKTLSLAKNNPNIEIIILPNSSTTNYQHILPKPTVPIEPKSPIPASYHVTQDGTITAPIYHVSNIAPKPSPQEEVQKFFNQARKPYHQQFSNINHMYLVDTSQNPLPKTTKRCSFPSTTDVVPTLQKQYIAPKSPSASTSQDVKPKSSESFVSWDAKMRQSIAAQDKETITSLKPLPEKKKKKSHRVRPHGDGPKEERSKKKRKKDKTIKKGKKKEKKEKKKKKKDKKAEKSEVSKKKQITPEFVLDSLSSGPDEDVSSKRINTHSWESDTMMADMLHKSLKDETIPSIEEKLSKQFYVESENCSTPKLKSENAAGSEYSVTKKSDANFLRPVPAFIEENANSSFDIDESTRPKPVFVPENSQCSCSGSHYRECTPGKYTGRSFSFQEGEQTDSPNYYNEESGGSVTVSTLFPVSSTANDTSTNSNNFVDSKYRTHKISNEDTESDVGDGDVMEQTEDEDEEKRETTSNLPPIFSQNKDLLESSDDERDEKLESKTISVSGGVSLDMLPESDNDSLNKSKTPIKAAKFLSPQHSISILEKNRAANRHISDELNDSQELSIDTDNGKSTTTSNSKVSNHHSQSSRDESTFPEKDNSKKESTYPDIPEDSCDQWYQNVTNKFNPKESHVCTNCKKAFPSLAVLEVHSGTCTKTSFLCKLCGKKCSSKSGLSNHLNSCLKPKSNATRDKKKTSHVEQKPKIKINKTSPSIVVSNIENTPNPGNVTPKKTTKKKKKRLGKQDVEQIEEFLGNLRYE